MEEEHQRNEVYKILMKQHEELCCIALSMNYNMTLDNYTKPETEISTKKKQGYIHVRS